MTLLNKRPDPQMEPSQADGKLLGLLSALLYAVFTLLPGSNSLMVLWPWVFVWQMTLTLPVIWLLWQGWHKPWRSLVLGNYLDWVAALTVVGLAVSTIFAEFPNQARWYGWAALCVLAALYAVNSWISTPQRWLRLLQFQGGLSLVFMVLSLVLWLRQTYWPELERLRILSQYGLEIGFDFNVVSLRNWHPVGHQNYVAGYLILVLPLLLCLGLLQKGYARWIWWGGVGLGLVNMYTTSSRGGLLSLAVVGGAALGVVLLKSKLSRLWIGLSGAGFLGLLLLLAGSNNRLRSLLESLVNGSGGGELAYRTITNAIGWRMGLSHWGSGIGVGGVPIAYQKYRPVWAGREAELAFQLHSTPAQLWGEMGIWGGLIPAVGIVLLVALVIRWQRFEAVYSRETALLTWAILGGLLGYSVISLTDYQLDNLCISGVIVVFLAALAYQFRQMSGSSTEIAAELTGKKYRRSLVGVGLGFFLIVQVWLIPVHRAWALSSKGFEALEQSDLDGFVQKLTGAAALAPWEPYYPYQLAWNLGNLSFQARDPAQQQAWREAAIAWFQTANAVSPYQEFGHSNLGWLLMSQDTEAATEAATEAFIQSVNLVPNKRGVFLGLGFSLLGQDQPALAVEAWVLELLRQPSLITSPIWQLAQFEPVYPRLVERLLQAYEDLINTFASQPEVETFLRQNRGALNWWLGNLTATEADWDRSGSLLNQAVLSAPEPDVLRAKVADLADSAAKLTLQAWINPASRQSLLEQAWAFSQRDGALSEVTPPTEAIAELQQGMENSSSLRQWLTENAPTWEPRSQRLGFGALSRHVDGPLPSDFLPRIENIPMTLFFADLMPSLYFNPPLDLALKEKQVALIEALKNSS